MEDIYKIENVIGTPYFCVINIDDDFKPVLGIGQFKVEKLTFNGGEQHIKLEQSFSSRICDNSHIVITHRLKTSKDFMQLCLVNNAVKELGYKKISLVLPYIPYGRQDRICNKGESFSIRVFADILNSMNFERVYSIDPHSDVTPALIRNFEPLNVSQFVRESIEKIGENLILVSPDAGANKKIGNIAKDLEMDFVKCDKVRDLKTGRLSGFQVFADDLNSANCLIVDDICDGGGTFIGIAEELKKKNAGKLYLYVTHGIFSKGINHLLEHFEEIYCLDAFSTLQYEGLTQLKIKI